jgi:hypothetical protein
MKPGIRVRHDPSTHGFLSSMLLSARPYYELSGRIQSAKPTEFGLCGVDPQILSPLPITREAR